MEEITKIKVNKKRGPLHTKEDPHNKLSELFKDKFGWNPRSEGTFAFSNETKANLFGILICSFQLVSMILYIMKI